MYLYFVFSSKTSILISDNTAHELCLLAAKSHSGCLRDSFGIRSGFYKRLASYLERMFNTLSRTFPLAIPLLESILNLPSFLLPSCYLLASILLPSCYLLPTHHFVSTKRIICVIIVLHKSSAIMNCEFSIMNSLATI